MRFPTLTALLLALSALSALAPASEAPLGGIGFRYDGSGVYAGCKPPTGQGIDPESGQGVRWKIPTANWGYSQPVEIGDQVLVLCEPGAEEVVWPTLVSYDRRTGEEQWRTAIDPLLAHDLSASERERLTAQMELFNEHYRFCYSSAAKFVTADEAGRAAINKKLATRNLELKGWKKGYGLLRKLKGEYEPLRAALKALKPYGVRITTWQRFATARVGVTFATPVTDGERILVQTLYGTVAGLDMDGKLLWIKDSGARQLGNKGQAASPRIVGELGLSCQNGLVVAWNLQTGKEVWRHGDPKKSENHGYIGSGAVMTLGDEVVFIDQAYRVLRVRDGKLLHDQLGHPKYASVCVDDAGDRVFLSSGQGERSRDWMGFKLELDGDSVTATKLWHRQPGLGAISPTFYQGLIYHSGTVLNPATGWVERGNHWRYMKEQHKKRMPGKMRGDGAADSRHLLLIADSRSYGAQEKHYKDRQQREHGPFHTQLEVYTTGSKKLAEILIPWPTVDEPDACKVWEQGMLPDQAPTYIKDYACPFSLGKDCIYVRNPAYLYCLDK